MNHNSEFQTANSHLFTLRIWQIGKNETTFEWIARIQDIENGEVKYFKNWQDLAASIETIIHNQNNNRTKNPKEIS